MKTSDISQTPLVRRYGVRGAKLFARLWFSLLYVFLIALAAALPVVGPEVAAGWRRFVVGCIAGALIVLAASLQGRSEPQQCNPQQSVAIRLQPRGRQPATRQPERLGKHKAAKTTGAQR